MLPYSNYSTSKSILYTTMPTLAASGSRGEGKEMPIIGKPLTSTLVLKYEDGVAPDGSPLIKQKSLNYVRPDADHESLHQVAVALFSLSELPLNTVILRDSTQLVEEPEE